MENEDQIQEPERKTEPAAISKEDMQQAINLAVEQAVKQTREAMEKEFQRRTLETETDSGKEDNYASLVEDLQ